ncbi:hypothetical protein U9M48_016266 [Paspalum notatum var. saurae]
MLGLRARAGAAAHLPCPPPSSFSAPTPSLPRFARLSPLAALAPLASAPPPASLPAGPARWGPPQHMRRPGTHSRPPAPTTRVFCTAPSSSSVQREGKELLVQHLLVGEKDVRLLVDLEKSIIAGGADLSDLAVEHSLCPSKENGGLFKEATTVYLNVVRNWILQLGSAHEVHAGNCKDQCVLQDIAPEELHKKMQDPNFLEEAQLIDVREPDEVAKASLPGFKVLPLRQFGTWGPVMTDEFNPQKDTYVLCHHGMRSMQVAKWLQSQGFKKVYNVTGGIHAEAPSFPPRRLCHRIMIAMNPDPLLLLLPWKQVPPLQRREQSDLLSPLPNPCSSGPVMADASSRTDNSSIVLDDHDRNLKMDNGQSDAIIPSNSSDRSDRSDKPLDQKTMRRLAQNREAARKSRLRKKAYVQQLESSKLKLAQLEQELQKARQQGIFISSAGDQTHAMSGNGALTFDIEYARWLEDQNKQINELRTAVNAHASDSDLRLIVDGIMAHYDEIFKVKGVAAKADVFHILSGMWKTPAERCFLWLGGFRPSELLKLLATHLEPLTEQQLLGLTNLQQSSQQAEDALSQGMEALQQSLAETLAGSLGPSGSSGNVANYMGQMAMAMGKLGTLENFLRQASIFLPCADNLRQQTLHQMQRILTIRQASRALLAIHDYFSRLRALSSLWLARPRE